MFPKLFSVDNVDLGSFKHKPSFFSQICVETLPSSPNIQSPRQRRICDEIGVLRSISLIARQVTDPLWQLPPGHLPSVLTSDLTQNGAFALFPSESEKRGFSTHVEDLVVQIHPPSVRHTLPVTGSVLEKSARPTA